MSAENPTLRRIAFFLPVDREWLVILLAALCGAIAAVIFASHTLDGITWFEGQAPPQYAHPIMLQIALLPGFIVLVPVYYLTEVLFVNFFRGLGNGLNLEDIFLPANALGYAVLAYFFVLIHRFARRRHQR